MGISGYAGRVLYVNLTDGSSRVEPLDERLAASLIGGFGINNRLAWDLMPGGVDPLSPENLIIIGAGPFAGTAIPGAAKVLVTTRFPMNGAFGTAAGGASFAPFLKSAGYDHVVISGRSSRPVVLRITEQQVFLDDAAGLWGGDTYETTDALHREHEPCSVIAIGQAGEN
ncbi:MAG: aldehyde ferredoxin oxidoreductase N-terminal domain-containing protein, partial [Dehalococcoidales bacterium]